MLDVSVQHSRNTFDPEWISLGHTLPVSNENWERLNLETFEVGVTQTHFQIHAMASDPKEDHHSKLFVVRDLEGDLQTYMP